MPTVSIYYDENLIGSSYFDNQFMVTEESGDLVWRADKQLAKSTHGEILIWIRFNAESKHRISFVRPDWQLIIDSVEYEPGFYQDVAIDERRVELRYGNFRFVCN